MRAQSGEIIAVRDLRVSPRRPLELIAVVTDERGHQRGLAVTIAKKGQMVREHFSLQDSSAVSVSAALRRMAEWVDTQ